MRARDRLVILVVVVVAAVVGAWLMVIQPKRDQAAKLGSQVSAAQSQLNSARADVAQGEVARRQFGSAYAELAKLGEAVPADDSVPSLIYQIQSAAGAAGVDFRSLQLNNNSNASTTATSSSGSSAAKNPNASLPPGVTVGPAGFPAEQFTFTFRGNFFHLADFFNRLQRFVVASSNRISVRGRLMTLNALNLGTSTGGFPQITATVSATTYLVPASQGLLAGATPTGPAGTPSGSSRSSAATPAAAIAPPVR